MRLAEPYITMNLTFASTSPTVCFLYAAEEVLNPTARIAAVVLDPATRIAAVVLDPADRIGAVLLEPPVVVVVVL